ncbi:hypothetical protein [Nocardioides panaciterrulae]|uniref:Lipoprotein n=1 Tax=Nocardioides panaciterrulae TaxID=661492 RepID=A0A7Y9E8Z4_9ACTN|nr:hypothetical protein [Nocardioides panaciterrulae]NYD43115.1 hypothetical protein [Nocardioides panaciterrulae]
MERSRSAFAALGLLLACALAGCSSQDPVPKVAPASGMSESVSPSASDPASESATATPSKKARPVAVVRSWVAARNKALRGEGVDDVRELSAPSCRTCDGLIEPIEEIYSSGGHFDTAGWRIAKARLRSTGSSRAVVDAGVVMAGGTTVSEAGATPNEYPPERHMAVFKLQPSEKGWLVSFLGFLS